EGSQCLTLLLEAHAGEQGRSIVKLRHVSPYTLARDSLTANPRKSTPAAEVAPALSVLRRRNAAARRDPPKMSADRYNTLANWASTTKVRTPTTGLASD